MLAAGWDAHKLNAPGKFLISAPGHDTPRRARAYLLTDDDVAATAARHASGRPALDEISRSALADHPTAPASIPPNISDDLQDDSDPETALWAALSLAPEQGISVPELAAHTGMGRRWIYYRLGELAADGKVIRTARGLWRVRRDHD
jgi:hypothetical protein